MRVIDRFRLDDRVIIITGGCGLLGMKHAEAIAEAGGHPVLWDIHADRVAEASQQVRATYGVLCHGQVVDITQRETVEQGLKTVLAKYGRVDALVNNAANDPKVKPGEDVSAFRFENYSLHLWEQDLAVGLTGAFFCSQVIGAHMAKHDGGVILNIASDLGVIAPDQRLYRKDGLPEDKQPVKPVTYSIVKHGLVGLTKYLATYWADAGIRVNAISPGGVYTNQPEDFVARLARLIPMGRMAHVDEYKATIVYLLSDASSYMTGTNVSIDGGRTCW